MTPRKKNILVRKILFGIFRQMTSDDVKSVMFFIRDESSKKFENGKDLMGELEELGYFNVTKLQFDPIIELLADIDRLDLHDKLKTQLAELSGKLSDAESMEEGNLIDFEDPSECAASNFTENKTENNNPQLPNSSIDKLATDFSAISLQPCETANHQFGLNNSCLNLENYSSATSQKVSPGLSDTAKSITNQQVKSENSGLNQENNSGTTSPKLSLGPSDIAKSTTNQQNNSGHSGLNQENNSGMTSPRDSLGPSDTAKSTTNQQVKSENSGLNQENNSGKTSPRDSPGPSDTAKSTTNQQNNSEHSGLNQENNSGMTSPRDSLGPTDTAKSTTNQQNNSEHSGLNQENNSGTTSPRDSLSPTDTAKSTTNQQVNSEDSGLNQENNSDVTPKVILYNYQNELAERGKNGKNSIICSPTGSGKTITAASVIKHYLQKAKENQLPFKVLYLVHIRYLVKHLAIDLKKILNDDVYPLEDSDYLNHGAVMTKPVVILTAQILDNALNSKSVSLSDYDLLVFDECHNTVHKHPYNEIMRKYYNTKRVGGRVPQILGLSATLGGGTDPFKAIVSLCANMDTLWVSCVRNEENKKELSLKNKLPIIDEVKSGKARSEDEFSKEFYTAIRTFISILESDYDFKIESHFKYGTKDFEGFLSTSKSRCEIHRKREEVKILEFLIIMNKTLIYYNELTALEAIEYLKNKFNERINNNSELDEKFVSYYEMIVENTNDFVEDDQLENNNKLLKLKELLTDILKDNPEKKVILLCLTRFNAIHLKDLINENRDLKRFVKPDFIIGQSKDDGLTQRQQADVLKRFEKGEINLLIATSIAEQGLNIPDCEIVIRYMYVTSDISRRQAQGRARKENSKYYLIVDEDSDEIYRDCRNKLLEQAMATALQTVTKLGEKEFKDVVDKKIEELKQIEDEKRQIEANFRYKYKAEDITILCKECHMYLCKGSDIIKKGSDYICYNPDFEQKVEVLKMNEKFYRFDSNIGVSKCGGENCSTQFGAVKRYFYGERKNGFVLNIKTILFDCVGALSLISLKKWSQHDFPIKEESLH